MLLPSLNLHLVMEVVKKVAGVIIISSKEVKHRINNNFWLVTNRDKKGKKPKIPTCFFIVSNNNILMIAIGLINNRFPTPCLAKETIMVAATTSTTTLK